MIRDRVSCLLGRIFAPNRMAVGPRLLLCALALGLVAGVHAQPFPSFLLDTAIVIGPDAGEADWTSVAFGNQCGLVAWTDGNLVKGCRFTRSLVPLDMPGLALSRLTSYGVPRLDVAWSRDTFLAVWAGDYGNGPVIEGALVSEDDTFARRVTLDSSDLYHSRPVVAANDSEFLVAWTEDTLGGISRVRYVRVSCSGVVLDTTTRTVAVHQGDQGAVDVAWGDTSYMVVWIGWNMSLYCNIIRSDGTRSSDYGYLITQESMLRAPVVSFDGRSFIVMWVRSAGRSFAPMDELRVVRVTPEGVVTDSACVAVEPGETDHRWYGVASVRDTTLLVWESWRDSAWCAYGVRLDSCLLTLDSIPIVLATPVGYHDDYLAPAGISCATVGDTFVVSWAGRLGPLDWPTPGRDVVCRRVTRDGVLPETTAVMMSYAAGEQYLPDVASDGTDFMAVWAEFRADSTLYDLRLYCARFSRSGAVLDTAPTCLAGPDAKLATIGYGGGCYLVAWRDGSLGATRRVLAVRIDRGGTLIDTVPIQVSAGDKYFYGWADIGYADSTFLIAMMCNYPNWHIYGSRISCDGKLLDSVPFVFPPGEEGPVRRNPGVATDGDSTFMVTRIYRIGNEASFVRCTSGGVILDSTEIILGDVPGNFDPVFVAPVRGPGEYFVVATTSVAPSVAWRVGYDGTVLDTIEDVYPFMPGTGAVYDGINYVVVGSHGDGGYATGVGVQLVEPDGTVVNYLPKMVVVLDTTRSRYSSKFVRSATNDEGVTAAVFSSYEQARYGSRRIRAAVWTPLGVCEEPAACTSPKLPSQTVVRGVLLMEDRGPRTGDRAVLLDAAGRKVLDLHPGENDVRALAPGVYFIREQPQAAGSKPQAVRKVVLTD